MRIAAVSRVDMTVDTVHASADFVMTTSKLHAYLLVGLSLVGMGGLLLPVAMIAGDSISNPQVFHTLVQNPGSSLLLTTGTVLGLLLLTFPLRTGLARLGGDSRVRMADGMVIVERQGLISRERWSEPLANFCGVTHHIRATLSGPRHEIILVHPEPSKDVLLHLSSRPPQEGVDHYARLLGLSELHPTELYSRRRHGPGAGLAGAAPVSIQARAA